MSGGEFNYKDTSLLYDLYGFDVTACCILGTEMHLENRKLAGDLNPMSDRRISELVFDVLCLIHSLDYYRSGDIGSKDYEESLEWVRDTYFSTCSKDEFKRYFNDALEHIKNKLEREFLKK